MGWKETLKDILADEGVSEWHICPFRTMTGGGFIVTVPVGTDIEILKKKSSNVLPSWLKTTFKVGDP